MGMQVLPLDLTQASMVVSSPLPNGKVETQSTAHLARFGLDLVAPTQPPFDSPRLAREVASSSSASYDE